MQTLNKLCAIFALALLSNIAISLEAYSHDRATLSNLPELTKFIEQLRFMANQRDAPAIREQIAPGFFIARDFGGMYWSGMPGWWNFSTSYAFAAKPVDPAAPWVKWAKTSIRPANTEVDLSTLIGAARFMPRDRKESWNQFLNELPRNFIQKSTPGGSHCGEAWPHSPLRWTVKDGLSMSGKTAYVLGDRVNLRAAPDLSSSVIGQFNTSTIVEIISDQSIPDTRHTYRWLEVMDYNNSKKTGFIVARQLMFTSDRMICFQRNTSNGAWQIVGVILGGD